MSYEGSEGARIAAARTAAFTAYGDHTHVYIPPYRFDRIRNPMVQNERRGQAQCVAVFGMLSML
jgi:hypothetical protein